MILPEHVRDELGIKAAIDEADLANYPGVEKLARETFGLTPEEFARACARFIDADVTIEVTTPRWNPRSWMYVELTLDGGVHSGVCVPDSIVDLPPTAAGQLLAMAWCGYPGVIKEGLVQTGIGVRATPKRVDKERLGERCVSQWMSSAPLLEGLQVQPQWVAKGSLSVMPDAKITDSRVFGSRVRELFIELLSEAKPKWRYLSTYRVFECGYLAAILEGINDDFFKAPSESVSMASRALESELEQFLSLVKRAGIETHFENALNAFDAIKSKGNRFASALDRALRGERQPQSITTPAHKGVQLCYKIRCAIVHAGMGSVVFDSYSDAAECLEAILPDCERAVLEYVGILSQ